MGTMGTFSLFDRFIVVLHTVGEMQKGVQLAGEAEENNKKVVTTTRSASTRELLKGSRNG